MHDFLEKNYVYFLDHAKSVTDLVEGLGLLSPFADDALAVAKNMAAADFFDFKVALARMRGRARQGDVSGMLKRYDPLVLPTRLIEASFIASDCGVPLGTALICLLNLESLEEKTPCAM